VPLKIETATAIRADATLLNIEMPTAVKADAAPLKIETPTAVKADAGAVSIETTPSIGADFPVESEWTQTSTQATVSTGVTVIGTPVSSIAFTPSAASFPAPVAPGTQLGVLSVLPSGWNGTLSFSPGSNDNSLFALGTNLLLLVDSTPLTTARNYTVVLNASPGATSLNISIPVTSG
jgi:hypothetical protein